ISCKVRSVEDYFGSGRYDSPRDRQRHARAAQQQTSCGSGPQSTLGFDVLESSEPVSPGECPRGDVLGVESARCASAGLWLSRTVHADQRIGIYRSSAAIDDSERNRRRCAAFSETRDSPPLGNAETPVL